jgi:hypothetical protein
MSTRSVRPAAAALAFGTLLALSGLSVSGCERRADDHNRPIGGGPRSEQRAHDEDKRDTARTPAAAALADIAQARCAREERCGNIGADKKWATTTACIDDERKSNADSFDAKSCGSGVSAHELAECVESVRKQDCGNPFSSLDRVEECRSGHLCGD